MCVLCAMTKNIAWQARTVIGVLWLTVPSELNKIGQALYGDDISYTGSPGHRTSCLQDIKIGFS